MKIDLGKNENVRDLETRWQNYWDDNSFWNNDVDSMKKPFTIMMPPPNVTGNLHMGHALNHITTDIIARYKRMDGYDVLWQPGTDHAAIATQMLVEKNLSKNGINPKTLSKEELLDYAWKWKNEYGSQILNQLHIFGVTPVWKRERFTMDEGLSKAVNTIFVKMYNDGLIYQDTKLVNWCPKQRTAVSDLETEVREEKGKFYYINYKLVDGGYIEIATTRPETLFGDMAIAISEKNEKLKHLIGKKAIVPLLNKEIPIIADEHADPEKGTGAVKITPAHDYDDYEVGKRHNLEMLNILTEDAKLNDNVPEKYRGLDRYVARKTVIEDIEAIGQLVKVEDRVMSIPYSQRAMVPVEPYLTTQWYVNAKVLAKKAIEVVENGDIEFIPEHRYNLYMAWMKDIKPWCISRQLWWGHQIPVWYDEDGNKYCAVNEEEAVKLSGGKKLVRDNDSLDTWFSSGLWCFSTLGWPENTKELKKYYSTDFLATASDIIFFWVARMIMMSMYVMDSVPFKKVYFHGLVRDSKGQKMSKTKGNGVDPLDAISKFGVDALRYWVTLAPIGGDTRYSDDEVKRGNKLTNKLWNASKFVLMNLSDFDEDNYINIDVKDRVLEDRWILSELNKTINSVRKNLDKYDIFNARFEMDTFFYEVFCDQYLEYIKDRFWNTEKYGNQAKLSAQITLYEVLRQILGLYSVIIPFVTEELYQKIYRKNEKVETLHLTNFPNYHSEWDTDVSEMDIALDILKNVRRLRTEKQIGATAKLQKVVLNQNIPESLYSVVISGSRADTLEIGDVFDIIVK